MTTLDRYVIVLWANDFEETAATLFVTELRRAGLRVKVVGLTRRRSPGVCGLALDPDLTLDDALPLAGKTVCVVIPCSSPRVKQLKNDPRLREFLAQVDLNQAKLVLSPLGEEELMDLQLFAGSGKTLFYPSREDMLEFVWELAATLRQDR